MPVTKNRGHLTVADTIQQTAHQLSTIGAENNPAGLGGVNPPEFTSLFLSQFLDQHCGFASMAMSVTGTTVIAGDVVQVVLTGPNAVGSASPVSGGLASPTAVNTLVGGNPVTPAVVTASYTVTSGDAAQGTLPLKLQAVATGLVAAINASAAVAAGTPFLATVSAPVAAAFTMVALLPGGGGAMPGFVAGITINAASTATPGTAGHASLSPLGAINPFAPGNPNLHLPTSDGVLSYTFGPNGQTCLVELTGGEPILLDSNVYAAALAAGISFSF